MPFDELKQKQSVMWGSGSFVKIEETIADVHEMLVERLAPKPGERFLDVGCGTGAVAMLAARAGADVLGVDLAPDLIETAKRRAAAEGLDITYEIGDCENLRFDDDVFDVVASSVGVMFAPDHAATARELARVTKLGGRLGLASWTIEGGLGRMFGMMKPFQPPPPEGAGSPFDWGDDERVRSLLGDAFDLQFEKHVSTAHSPSSEDYWQLFVEDYGPTKTLANSLDPDRREEFHQAWIDFFDQNFRSNGGIAHDKEYLLVLGKRR